ncbi:hypothetical protein LuPra_01167 [Luteitalea pratensis]|uniref:Outer membrane protein/protective antigen OMA87 n=1 Tax=Luteitalea pratensis TaxID=1855912 RepID=A0A143PJN4_LUTPR|nr:hypothetical protein [Luteitalea pratensis]AMY07979.1 hypothetical protein LuPra_01167 [Luteitalea pratensis]
MLDHKGSTRQRRLSLLAALDGGRAEGRPGGSIVALVAGATGLVEPEAGTSLGAMGAYLHKFDPVSRVSLFGVSYQYTSTHSTIASAFARASFGADHHRLAGVAVLGYIKNDYDDYLGSGQPLKTADDLRAAAGRYLYRVKGNWLLGAQGVATNYQVFGESTQDNLVLETLGLVGYKSVALGAVVMHDSRDNEDMPRRGWFLDLDNRAYREGLGGEESFDAYRADLRIIWPQRGGHLMAFRQYNWLTQDAPSVAQATVVLRGYKQGQYLAPHMSSVEAEERLSLGSRWTSTMFAGLAGLYGNRGATSSNRQFYPNWGAGLQLVIKPAQRMLVNLEYAQGVEGNRGIYLKFGYGW